MLWGIWDVTINAEDMTAEIVPIRGADFTANVTQFLQPPLAPTNLLTIQILPGSDPLNGYFEVNVTAQHPFPGNNKYNGFDVRGILMSNGSVLSDHDPTVLYASDGDTVLENADGYTRWWNPDEFTSFNSIFGFTSGKLGPPNLPTATVNPYKQFADSLDPDSIVYDIDTGTRGIFTSSKGSNTRRYDIQFRQSGGQNVFDFQYAVSACWEEPDGSYAPDFPPDAFSLSANSAEAFMVSVADAGSTAFYENSAYSGGELILNISVYDWQGTENVSGAMEEISAIWIEGPVLSSLINVFPAAEVVTTVGIETVLKVTLSDLDLNSSGEKILFGSVESENPTTYIPQINGGQNFDYPDSPLSAYFMAAVNIKDKGPVIPPEGPGKIAWVSNVDGDFEIYRMQGDGTNQTRLTYSPGHDWEPHWSPDGTKIVWRRGGYDAANIWLMDEDGGNQEQITFDGWNFDPTWTPDAEWIFYWSYDGVGGGSTKLWKIRPDGMDQQQVTFFDTVGVVAAPDISPNNDLIAFEGPGPGGGPRDLWTCNIGGTGEVDLSNTNGWESSPDFNSDGTKICFAQESPSGVFRIYSINPDGSEQEQLTYPPAGQNEFSGSFGVNDEQLIVWRRMGSQPEFDEIGVYDLATDEFTQLTFNAAYDQYPDWHPND